MRRSTVVFCLGWQRSWRAAQRAKRTEGSSCWLQGSLSSLFCFRPLQSKRRLSFFFMIFWLLKCKYGASFRTSILRRSCTIQILLSYGFTIMSQTSTSWNCLIEIERNFFHSENRVVHRVDAYTLFADPRKALCGGSQKSILRDFVSFWR